MAKSALLVVIDADVGAVRRRHQQLDDTARESGVGERAPGEAIVHFVPKRNVETWILCLGGLQVDEETDYSDRKEIDDLIAASAITLFEWSRPNKVPPPNCAPSLSEGIVEVSRLG